MSGSSILSSVARFLEQIMTPLHILRAPIIAAIVGFVGLSQPAQTLEVYRALALDRNQQAIQIQIGLALLTLLGACIVIWYIARNFTLRFQASATASYTVGGALLRWLPRLLGALPLVGAGIGLFKAARRIDPVQIDKWFGAQMKDMLPYLKQTAIDYETAITFLSFMGGALLFTALFFMAIVFIRSRGRIQKFEDPTQFLFGRAIPLLGFFVIAAMVTAYCIYYYISTDGATALAVAIGSIAIFNLFIIFLTLVLGFLSFVHYQTNFPAITALVLIAVVATAFDLNDNHELRTLEGKVEERPGLSFALTDWMKGRPDRAYYQKIEFPYLADPIGPDEDMADEIMQRRAYPVYVIAAQGGGIYAAHQTALALARVQDRCPAFAQHIFAISGVSGGSLGAALFAALVNFHTRGEEPVTNPTCIDKPVLLKKPGWYEEKVNKFMSSDFLSPIVAGGLFPDFIQRFLPFPINGFDRARAFEAGLERAWRRALPEDRENSFAKNFYHMWDEKGTTPALVLNTVEVQSGSRRLISPFVFKSKTLNRLETVRAVTNQNIRISTAVGLSARFPWLLPAATVKSEASARDKIRDRVAKGEKKDEKNLRQFRFVDGGIYEYSGAATGLEIAEFIDKHMKYVRGVHAKTGRLWDANARVEFLVISDDEILEDASDPQKDSVRLKARREEKSERKLTKARGLRVRNNSDENVRQGFGELLSPVRSLLNSRIERAIVWVTRAFDRFCKNCYKNREYNYRFPGFDGSAGLYRINHTNYKLTLGWQLSRATRQIISAHSGFAQYCRAAIPEIYGGWPWAGLVYNQDNCTACRIEHDLQTSWLTTTGYLRENVKLGGTQSIASPCRSGEGATGLRNRYLPRLPTTQPTPVAPANPVP